MAIALDGPFSQKSWQKLIDSKRFILVKLSNSISLLAFNVTIKFDTVKADQHFDKKIKKKNQIAQQAHSSRPLSERLSPNDCL